MPRPAPSSLRLLLPYLRPYVPALAGATVALLATTTLTLLIGQGLKKLIDSGFGSHSAGALNVAALAMFGVVAALAVATYARFSLISWLGERVGADLRRALYDHVITLSPGYFETARTGDILSRMTADTGLLQALVGSSISMWVRSLLTMIGALALLIATSPKLAGIVVLVVPLVVVPLKNASPAPRRIASATLVPMPRKPSTPCPPYRPSPTKPSTAPSSPTGSNSRCTPPSAASARGRC